METNKQYRKNRGTHRPATCHIDPEVIDLREREIGNNGFPIAGGFIAERHVSDYELFEIDEIGNLEV